jgi:hypothetical protein
MVKIVSRFAIEFFYLGQLTRQRFKGLPQLETANSSVNIFFKITFIIIESLKNSHVIQSRETQRKNEVTGRQSRIQSISIYHCPCLSR